jgi:hypothetical protein
MRVLVACEFSGRVRAAFRKLGHDAWSCDIIPSDDDSAYHIIGDALELLDKEWDLLIAHPPCTYLSNAGARHLFPKSVLNTERLALGMEAKEFFMALYESNIPRICIENPIPSKIYGLPAYSQFVQPFEHGHQTSKKTCLWLKGLTPLQPTNIVNKTETTMSHGSWFGKGGEERRKLRSVTFQGIADAMAQQWGACE